MYAGLTLNDRFTFMAVVDKEREGREGDGESPHCRLRQRIVEFPFLDLLIKDTPRCPSTTCHYMSPVTGHPWQETVRASQILKDYLKR